MSRSGDILKVEVFTSMYDADPSDFGEVRLDPHVVFCRQRGNVVTFMRHHCHVCPATRMRVRAHQTVHPISLTIKVVTLRRATAVRLSAQWRAPHACS